MLRLFILLAALLVSQYSIACAEIQNDDISWRETLQKQSDMIKVLLDRVSRLEAKVMEGGKEISELKASRTRDHVKFDNKLREMQNEMSLLHNICGISEENGVLERNTSRQNQSSLGAGVDGSLSHDAGRRRSRIVRNTGNFNKHQRHRRLLADPSQFGSIPTQAPRETSFYAYSTQFEVNPSNHHTLVYDKIMTNNGNGFNNFTGIFTVPVSGVYVFLWNLRLQFGQVVTELVVNSNPVGSILTYIDGNPWQMTTGFAVIHVNVNDVVYVRTHPTYSHTGILASDYAGRNSFAGWSLG